MERSAAALQGPPRGTVPQSPNSGGASWLSFDVLTASGALGSLALAPLLGWMTPLIFLLLGCMTMARRPDETVRILIRHWYFLTLPLFAISSMLWSPFPELSLRYGIQLLATMAIGICLAYRVSPHRYIVIVFVASFITMLASMLFGNARLDGIALGVFASKNAFATNIAIFAIAAVGVFFSRESQPLLRLAALAGIAISPGLLLAAQSSGALITLGLSLATFATVIFAQRLSPGARRAYAATAFAALAVASILAAAFGNLLLEAVLGYFDKDVTITGRTDLWSAGLDLIARNPLLGVGYQSFWVQGTEEAETLWAIFHVASRAGFHFHNTYISIGVELGIIGAALTAGLLLLSLIRVAIWATKQPSAINAYFLAFGVFILARSFVEVDVFYQFSLSSITVAAGFIYEYRARARTASAPLPAKPGATRFGLQRPAAPGATV